jgi:LacI family transcriptional regulator
MTASKKTQSKVTMADIAARCGVSRVTVSYALRGANGEVSDETRKRVMATAKEMGYNPAINQSARRLIAQHHGHRVLNHAVGVALPWDFGSSTYYSKLLNGVMQVMSEDGYGVHLSMLLYDEQKKMPLVKQALPLVCGRGEIDGLLVSTGSFWFVNVWLDELRAEPNYGDRPIIGLVEPIPGCSSVHADDFSAGYQAASHLLALGHRHIFHGFVLAEEAEQSFALNPEAAWVRRQAGICQAVRDMGLDPGTQLHEAVLMGPAGLGGGLVRSLNAHPEITAIIAPNDTTALFVLGELSSLGIRVPEDMSVIGFDDTENVVLPNGRNMLSTVRIPLQEIGMEGARLMIRSINGEVKSEHNIVLPVELVVRDSTARPPAREHGGR